MNRSRNKFSMNAISLKKKDHMHNKHRSLGRGQIEFLSKLGHKRDESQLLPPVASLCISSTTPKLSSSRNHTAKDYLESVDIEEALRCYMTPSKVSAAFIRKLRLNCQNAEEPISSDCFSFSRDKYNTNTCENNMHSIADRRSILSRISRRKIGLVRAT